MPHRAAASARTSIPTTYSCCRAFGGAAGATAASRSRAAKPGMPSRSCASSRPARRDAPAGRHALPAAAPTRTTASRSMRARPTRSDFAPPSAHELAQHFLDYLRDRIDLPGRYARPGPRARRASPRASARDAAPCARGAGEVRWNRRDSRAIPRLLPVRAQAHGVLRAARAAAVRCAPSRPRSRRNGLRLDGARSCSTTTQVLPQRRGARVARRAVLRALANRACAPRRRRNRWAVASCMVLHADTAWIRPPRMNSDARRRARRETRYRGRAVRRHRRTDRARAPPAAGLRHRPVRRRLAVRQRANVLSAFLRAQPQARVEMIVHDTRWMEMYCPRLLGLLRLHSHAVTVYRTGSEARSAMDPLLIVDGRHYPAPLSHRSAARGARRSSSRSSRDRSSCASSRYGPPASRDSARRPGPSRAAD